MGKGDLESSGGWEKCEADRGQKPDRGRWQWEKNTELMVVVVESGAGLGSKGHTPEVPIPMKNEETRASQDPHL